MPFIFTEEIEFVDCHVGGEIQNVDGNLHIEDTFVTVLTSTGDGSIVQADNSRFTTVTLTGMNGGGVSCYALFSNCLVASRFIVDDCVNVEADLNVQSTTNGTKVDVTSSSMVNIRGTVTSTGTGSVVRLEDVVASEVGLLVIHDPPTDNTTDSVSLEGVCDRLSIRGSIRAAITGANNSRYGLAVAAGCLLVDVWTPISGFQTGAINDLTAGQVTVH